MPLVDLPDDELAAVIAAVRSLIEDDKFPLSPRLDPLRAALARLEAASDLKTPGKAESFPKAPPAGKGERGRR